MKIFLFVIFFNPAQGYHLHSGFWPLEYDNLTTCESKIEIAEEFFKTRAHDSYKVGCIEADSMEDAAKKVLEREQK